MAIKRVDGGMSVVEAARRRLLNAFSNGVKIYMSFSAGKDSLCMAHLTYELIRAGRVDPRQLVILFFDEEAIYPSMEEMTREWYRRFTLLGADFRWYCLPFKQVSGFHQLQNDELWITWEPGKEDCWVRQPPPFAITQSPYLQQAGQMNYVTFCRMITKDGIQLIGVRATESIQRVRYLSELSLESNGITGKNAIYPIYDWHDSDIWLYIKEHGLKFPEAYIHLYQAGVNRNRLRLSNFFAMDSCAGLRTIAETDPDLWRRIEKREPNAYLTLLYWDSEMFKRNSRRRQELEGESGKDHRELVHRMLFVEPELYFTTPARQRVANNYRRFYVKAGMFMQPKHWRTMHDALKAGDPKLRSLRALWSTVFRDYTKAAEASAKEVKRVEQH